MRGTAILRAALIALAAAGANLAAQTTYIVDAAGGPGSHFTQIQAAITAARDGDALRIRPGTYAPFSLANKGLRIIGDSSATVVVEGSTSIAIGPTAARQAILIQGLTTRLATVSGATPRVSIHDAGGAVVLRDVVIGTVPIQLYGYHSGLDLARCAQVHLENVSALLGGTGSFAGTNQGPMVRIRQCFAELTRVQIAGLPGDFTNPRGGVGLLVEQSDVFITSSIISGGTGGGDRMAPGDGGPGIRADIGSFLVVAGRSGSSTVVGGQGYTWSFWWWSYSLAGHGGPGIELSGASTAWFEGTAPTGGPPGTSASGSAGPGPPYTSAGGSRARIRPSSWPALAALNGTPSPSQTVQFHLAAGPNATAFLALGTATSYLPLAPGAIGALLIATPDAVLLGPVPLTSTGTLDLSYPIPAVWPFVDRPIHGQFLVVHGAEIFASNSIALVVRS